MPHFFSPLMIHIQRSEVKQLLGISQLQSWSSSFHVVTSGCFLFILKTYFIIKKLSFLQVHKIYILKKLIEAKLNS